MNWLSSVYYALDGRGPPVRLWALMKAGYIHYYPAVLNRAVVALNAVVKTSDASQQTSLVRDLRQSVCFAASGIKGQSEFLPGCCLLRGIAPLLAVYREAILNCLPEVKKLAAQGVGETMKPRSTKSLKPSPVTITG